MENSLNDLVILLTGTITPNSYSNLTIRNPIIRHNQYLEAVNFYLKHTELKIVFAENSGNCLKKFPVLPNRIEYLTFNSVPMQTDKGIGYKEIEIIDFAFKNSKFIKEANSVVKITGRLKVLNLKNLVKKFLKLKKNKLNLVYANPFDQYNMDSRCFFFTKDFWPYLKNAGKNINLKYNFEFSLWDSICEYQKNEKKNYITLNTPLRIEGTSGSFGIKYKHHLLFHYLRFIRTFIYKLHGKRVVKKQIFQNKKH